MEVLWKLLNYGSSGPVVDLLQSTLAKLGYYSGKIDGFFGSSTTLAVQNFQRDFGLIPDGIVGSLTWDLLFPYLNGYSVYTVCSR